MTARWVVDEVKDQRDLNITWQPISLLLKNQPPEDSPYYQGVLGTYKMLRVMESVRAAEGDDAVFPLYWELGSRIHHDGQRSDLSTAGRSDAGSAWAMLPPIVPLLRTAGSPIFDRTGRVIGVHAGAPGGEAVTGYGVRADVLSALIAGLPQ